jgi:hypothetical protein
MNAFKNLSTVANGSSVFTAISLISSSRVIFVTPFLG